MARNSSSNVTISDSKAKVLPSAAKSVVMFTLLHSCMGVATLRHILCFIYGLKLLLAQRSSKKKIILHCIQMCSFLCSICRARRIRTWGVVRKEKIGPCRHWLANQSPSWFSFSDLTAMEMQMLGNFKLCWTASCNKKYGLKHSHRKHSLFSFTAVLLPAVCFWVIISWDSLNQLLLITASSQDVQVDHNSCTE